MYPYIFIVCDHSGLIKKVPWYMVQKLWPKGLNSRFSLWKTIEWWYNDDDDYIMMVINISLGGGEEGEVWTPKINSKINFCEFFKKYKIWAIFWYKVCPNQMKNKDTILFLFFFFNLLQWEFAFLCKNTLLSKNY